MKTTVSILVKNENLWTKANSSLLWFVKIFQKSKVLVSINGAEPCTLVASKEFHEFEVEPGTVTLRFTDPGAKSKARNKAIAGGLIGFSAGAATGGSGLSGALAGSEAAKSSIKEDILECTLQEGDNLKLSCRSKGNGQVKVKVLKN